MKEATGELNMTVVTIVAIGALLAFFYAVIWPSIQRGMALSAACNAANGQAYKSTGTNSCVACTANNGVVTCNYFNNTTCTGQNLGQKTCNAVQSGPTS